MTTEVHELPEEGEIVIATIDKIGDHGAYVTLDEYNKVQGFLHVSEIAHGWVRNINKFVKSGEKKVLLVKKIREGRAEIDLSLKQVSREQRKNKLLDVKRFQKGKGIIKNIQEKTKLSDDDIEKLEDKIFSKPCKLFLMFSTPLELLSVNSKMPLISTDGNLILILTSSITLKIFFGNFKSLKTLIPFLAISITPS